MRWCHMTFQMEPGSFSLRERCRYCRNLVTSNGEPTEPLGGLNLYCYISWRENYWFIVDHGARGKLSKHTNTFITRFDMVICTCKSLLESLGSRDYESSWTSSPYILYIYKHICIYTHMQIYINHHVNYYDLPCLHSSGCLGSPQQQSLDCKVRLRSCWGCGSWPKFWHESTTNHLSVYSLDVVGTKRDHKEEQQRMKLLKWAWKVTCNWISIQHL